MNERDLRILRAWREGDDQTFMLNLALANLENAYRPRDEFDVDVHPESLRGKVLAMYDAYDALPTWFRFLARVMAWRPFRR